VFGWRFQKWEGQQYWLIRIGEEGEPGIEGAIKPNENPAEGVVDTIGVASVDEIMRKIKANGGKLLTLKMSVPEAGWLVYFLGPEVHRFGAIQADPKAK